MDRVVAMILAGGRGKRMNILCYDRAKPNLPFGGKYRVIDFTLSNCLNSNINHIAVLTDYQRSNMANYLRKWNSSYSVPTFHLLEPKFGSYSGTADAIYQNMDYLEQNDIDKVLVLAADHIYKMDYRKMLAFHEQVKADVTVGVIPVPMDEAYRFGIANTDTQGKITSFAEKPETPQNNLASMGIYVFNKEALFQHLEEDAREPSSPHDFGYAIIPKMISQARAFAYKFNDYWQDIGNIEAYYQANIELTGELPPFSLDGSWPIYTRTESLPSPKLGKQGLVKQSLISPGCTIKGQVERSVISPGVWISEQAVVRDSVIMANAFIGEHSVVDGCIVDEDVNIGKYCYVGFGNNPARLETDITVLGKSVTVPSGTAIGRNCVILPNTGRTDFTTSAIRSGSVISPSVAPAKYNGNKVAAT